MPAHEQLGPHETFELQIDRPGGGWRDAQRRDPREYERELLSAMATETREGTVLRGCLYRGVRPVRTLVYARHDGDQWRFEETADPFNDMAGVRR